MYRLTLSLVLASTTLFAQRFLADDPLEREPPPLAVSKAISRKLSDAYDLFSNQFHRVGERQLKKGTPVRAQAVNTIGEPMDGSWYTKRHYYQRMSQAELALGPSKQLPPSTKAKWTVVAAKTEGVTPGFTVVDADARVYFLKFDPMTNPEMATSADSIAERFFHALGYYVPDNYLVHFRKDQLQLAPGTQMADSLGKKRPMSMADLDAVLKKVPLTEDGSYRATASLAVDGQPIGPPRYYGTRQDDPNDIVPHEHRRDLRGLQVFCAWLGHDDSRAINNLDTVVTIDGVPSVRHYLMDFGSTLGSASTGPNSPRAGAYFFSWANSAKQFLTLGLLPPYWAFAHYPHFPSIGRFEWRTFDPQRWVPEYPNAAFDNRLPDDEFWAAKQVMAFTDEDIDTIVGTGKLSDKAAAAWLAECLRERRNKIGKAYFQKVLPLDRFRVDDGRLLWEDLGRKHNLGAVDDVKVRWSVYDNGTGGKSPIAGAEQAAVPQGGPFLVAELTSAARPRQTVSVYVRRSNGSAKVVGLDRTW